ncbi:MAG: hypothetical protein JW825_00405 [Candidatus Methanofastidiosa archaeon]|nr:hypothetical protein [Candidatus Methanofastidiosa archaeon]
MKKVLLCSGAQHLENSFKGNGFETYSSFDNYDNKRFFMNSDIYSRIPVEELSGEDLIVVQCGTLSQLRGAWYNTQDRVFELLEFLSILRCPQKVMQTGHKRYAYELLDPPRSVEVVYTCMPCAKQDHACLTGEVNSAKLAIDLTLSMSERVHIIDPHPPTSLGWFQKLINRDKVNIISMIEPLLQKAASEMPDAVILGPDEGASERLGIKSFSKSRISSVESTISGSFDVDGLDVLIVDDMVLSGGTLRKTGEKLRELGAKRVGAAITHALPVWGGEENLQKVRASFQNQVYVTNTVYTDTFKDCALDCVGEIIKHI